MHEPASPRLFLVDGYALIYRAFYALISRPLRTGRGENTSAVWGIANFLQRLARTHKPEYLGWVHDSGLSFRHELYPEYKATREKLTDELQADFDTGLERIEQLLDAYGIPVIALDGYEADDVIGTLVRKSVEQKLNVVVISGDKDFQQLVREGVWLLNPGRGGPAAVEEHWISVENGNDRLGVPPHLVTDYLALLGDSSDNVPGVHGIGDKGARELIEQFGPLENIIAHAGEITKKRPRESLLANIDNAKMSKVLVTIQNDLNIELDFEALRFGDPDPIKLRNLYVELEFHGLARAVGEVRETRGGASGGAGGGSGGGSETSVHLSSGDAVAGASVTVGASGARGASAATVAADPFGKVGPASSAASAPKAVVRYRTITTVAEMLTMITRAREVGRIAVDTETIQPGFDDGRIDPLRTRLVSISIATAPGEAWYLPLAHSESNDTQQDLLNFDSPVVEPSGPGKKPIKRKLPASAGLGIAGRILAERTEPVTNLPAIESDEMAPLRLLLEDESVKKVGQNVKYDTLVLRRAGVNMRGMIADTMIASYVLDPGRRTYGLDLLALEFIGHRMTSYDELVGKGKDAIRFDKVPISAACDYSCEDTDMTLRLAAIFLPQLEDHGLTRLFNEIEMPLIPVLGEMEWTGISIDLQWFRSLKERFQRERDRVAREIHAMAGGEFNINSNQQLREILFVKLGLPVLKKTATGPSTDASVLQQFADQGEALPALILEYRELAKLENTYLDALPALVNPDTGRLHTSFNQTVASTGRLSSSDPNLQNIPIRRELGRDIRRGFVPREGWLLLTADYSQIELRLLAHLSADAAFVEAFRAGGDIHRQTAALIFGVPIEEVSSEMRGRAKTINFATIYGQGPHALSQQIGVDYATAKEFITTYFERFSGIRAFLDSCVDFAKANGYVETLFGRRRYIPELKDRNFNIRAFGERTAANSPIQGSAADLIKVAMIRIDAEFVRMGLKSRMLLQVHDELVFEVAPEELDVVKATVKVGMEQAAELSVPLVVDMGVGDNWVSAKSG